jgi:hypothetical protein
MAKLDTSTKLSNSYFLDFAVIVILVCHNL